MCKKRKKQKQNSVPLISREINVFVVAAAGLRVRILQESIRWLVLRIAVGDYSRAARLGDDIGGGIEFEMITTSTTSTAVDQPSRVMTGRGQLSGRGLLQHILQVAHI